MRFQVADAEALPFADGSFDVVLSTFGAMFAPDHARTAREMMRVLRPGGRIGMANWTPEGFIGRLFKVIGAHVPPPAGLKPPALWGTEAHLAELFGAHAAQIRCERRHLQLPLPLGRALGAGVPRLLRPDAQGLRRARRGRPAGARARHHSRCSTRLNIAGAGLAGGARASTSKSSSPSTEGTAMKHSVPITLCAALLAVGLREPADRPGSGHAQAGRRTKSLAMIVAGHGRADLRVPRPQGRHAASSGPSSRPTPTCSMRTASRSAATAPAPTGRPSTAAASSARVKARADAPTRANPGAIPWLLLTTKSTGCRGCVQRRHQHPARQHGRRRGTGHRLQCGFRRQVGPRAVHGRLRLLRRALASNTQEK